MGSINQIEILNYVGYFLFFVIQIIVIYYKRDSIWKGVCGGNGIPQPNEVIKISAFLTLNFQWAGVLFLGNPADIETLISSSAIIGITSLPQLRSFDREKK